MLIFSKNDGTKKPHLPSAENPCHPFEEAAGGVQDELGGWNSARHAAFPPGLNYFLAKDRRISGFARGHLFLWFVAQL